MPCVTLIASGMRMPIVAQLVPVAKATTVAGWKTVEAWHYGETHVTRLAATGGSER